MCSFRGSLTFGCWRPRFSAVLGATHDTECEEQWGCEECGCLRANIVAFYLCFELYSKR